MSTSTSIQTATIKTITWRLMPTLMLCFIIAFIDRSNISVAALQMNADLSLTAKMYGLGVGLFYVTYVLLEVPSNIMLAKVGARRWIARIMVTWGLVACGMAFIQTAHQLYGMRILLGAAEAGFTPGIIYYLSRWFPAGGRARAMGIFYIAAALAAVIGLPLSGALLKMDGILGVAGWRWLYFVEGIPAIVMGLAVLRLLPDNPASAKWLSHEQSLWLVRTIDQESSAATGAHAGGWHRAFIDGKVWLLSLFWLCLGFGTIGVSLFLPLILKSRMGGTDFVVSLYSALPFVLSCLLMHFNGRHSDIVQERRLHMAVPPMLAGLFLAASVTVDNSMLAYVLILISTGLTWAAIPVFWAVTTQYLAGGAAAAGAIALINSVSNLGGLGLPPVIGAIKDHTGSYNNGLLMVAAGLFFGGILAYVLVDKCVPRTHSTPEQ